MRTLAAFMKKEFTAQLRSGRVLILGLLFVLLGIMNPAVAKLTPWLMEIMADALSESGMSVTVAEVSAMDSWLQFYKNLPIGLIVFILLESSIFTKEYSSGTLILSLTKGLERHKVVVSKSVVLAVFWTFCFWLCFAITYGFNAHFWDNSIAQNLLFSALCWWLFGMMTLALVVLFSTVSGANVAVLLGTGGTVMVSYLAGLLPKCSKYLPTFLTGGSALIYGLAEAAGYVPSFIIALAITILCFAISIPIFNKKQL